MARDKRTIQEFKELGIGVLEPSGDWVLQPFYRGSFRPLSNETRFSPGTVEDNFLIAITHSDFLYVDSHQRYVGDMASLEIGFALGKGKPVFVREEPSEFLDVHPEMMIYIKVATPKEVKKFILESREQGT